MAWDELEGHFTREVAWEDLRDARFESCTFEGVDLEGALFGQTKLAGADFRTATGWRIRPEENRVKGAKFRRDDLSGLVEGWDLDLS